MMGKIKGIQSTVAASPVVWKFEQNRTCGYTDTSAPDWSWGDVAE